MQSFSQHQTEYFIPGSPKTWQKGSHTQQTSLQSKGKFWTEFFSKTDVMMFIFEIEKGCRWEGATNWCEKCNLVNLRNPLWGIWENTVEKKVTDGMVCWRCRECTPTHPTLAANFLPTPMFWQGQQHTERITCLSWILFAKLFIKNVDLLVCTWCMCKFGWT